MSAILPRRGFLRGLAALPLIGGGVTLIGQPTAAAVPVTDTLHERYFTWLAHECNAAYREREYRASLAVWRPGPDNYESSAEAFAARVRDRCGYGGWTPKAPDIANHVASAPPSSRAAVILSAAGVPLTPGERA